MEEMIAVLRKKGYKMTPQRRAVIKALFECGKFPTANQILEHVKRTNPDMGLDTVYRNLSLLCDVGAIEQIHVRGRDGNVYELVTNGHHHHLVCLNCGKADCLDYCPVNEQDLKKAQEKGFQLIGHSLELYGYCRECSKQAAAGVSPEQREQE